MITNRLLLRAAVSAAAMASGLASSAASGAELFREDFNGLPLGPNQEEFLAGTNVWTNVPPTGWIKDDSGVPGFDQPPENNGVKEWIGWAFADHQWWKTIAGDQGRTQFVNASGGIMVADADEWDDAPHPGRDAGYPADRLYTARVMTPTIPLANVVPGTVVLAFDSSWRPEGFDDGANVNNQTALLEAIFSDGTTRQLLHWDSDPSGPYFKPDAQNEHVTLPVAGVPVGATDVRLRFTLGNAANDWWWGVDNVSVNAVLVPEPSAAAAVLAGAVALLRHWRRART